MKYAIFSMDIEEWYHLDYLRTDLCDLTYSMLDGVYRYCEIISDNQIPSSFFVLGELAKRLKRLLIELGEAGYDIGSHGFNHQRPITMDVKAFKDDVVRCKRIIEDTISKPVYGYRAPCFSLDRQRLDILQEVGFKYDSSKIVFKNHPLYSDLDVGNFVRISDNIYSYNDFIEFEVSTLQVGKKHFPVSGGGYLRIFPWQLTQNLIRKYSNKTDLYILYIHPFELSSKENPLFPERTKWHNRIRFSMGRRSVCKKLNSLINLLKEEGYTFTTFYSLRKKLLDERIIDKSMSVQNTKLNNSET